MTAQQQALAALHGDLEALRAALDAEDHAEAGRIASEHDRRLREFVLACDVHSAADGLRGLLAVQQALTVDMRRLRDIAAAHLRASRQSVRAAGAYHQTESLA